MEHPLKCILLANNFDSEIRNASKGRAILPKASFTDKTSSKRSFAPPFPSKPFNSPPSSPFQQTQMDLTELKARKASLESECSRLDEEILSKQQKVRQLQGTLESIKNEHHTASASKLAAGLAHEIRNPLTTIKGFIQLLKPELEAIGKLEFAEVVLEEIQRANHLLSDFLSIYKQGSSGKNTHSLNQLAKSMRNLFASEALLKEIDLKVQLPDVDIHVHADENQLKQVSVNLLKNAFEAIEANRGTKGEITIVVRKHNGNAEFSVTDNGAGLDENDAAKIFSPLYTTKEKGTGIGLAICKQIIEEHDGKLDVETTNFQTRFFFALPAI
jgi:signal transduction histidine kinase